MKNRTKCLLLMSFCVCISVNGAINRQKVVMRNAPLVLKYDSLSPFSVGNGEFCFTTDITGLQSFPNAYKNGIPLGTMSQWGWHSFANPKHLTPNETLKSYNFRGHDELYAVPFNEPGRSHDAGEWFRANPNRMHLGVVGFAFKNEKKQIAQIEEIKNIHQRLNLWNGCIESNYTCMNRPMNVSTWCDPERDQMMCRFASKLINEGKLSVVFRFPYPTGKHTDDACSWTPNKGNQTNICKKGNNYVVLKRQVDQSIYYVTVKWIGKGLFKETGLNNFQLIPKNETFSFSCAFTEALPSALISDVNVPQRSAEYWEKFWTKGGMIDCSGSTSPQARELERRVVLSQYLLAIQCAGDTPPQETGLTYNSWFGKFHLEMTWWHEAWLALWGHTDMLERVMGWYEKVAPAAHDIAHRQKFNGIRWMKMTDPSGTEAPSKVGSFLIWQQPHYIYLAELIYRSNPSTAVLRKYNKLVQETADFMDSFATYDSVHDRYVLKGIIPAQETLRADRTVNPPFELSYWHYALEVAQQWKERLGEKRDAHRDKVIAKLSPLAEKEGLYLAAESEPDTYKNIKMTSDHPAVLGALGILPWSKKQVDLSIMGNTFDWVMKNWNWNETWGWDFPMVAMTATRLGRPQDAINSLLMPQRTNTYLNNGHNFQDQRLRIYLPGNGGLLTAVALMCAGWDGCNVKNPGIPNDSTWHIQWEGIRQLP